MTGLTQFQFPPPRGGELKCHDARSIDFYFNSRPREGANEDAVATRKAAEAFQFPPPRGGEPFNPEAFRYILISIPAPARGRT